MKIALFEDVPTIEPVQQGFRAGNISFKDLMQGEEGAPDNYGLQWVTVEDAFSTPRHRHSFEQVRILIEGRFGFGPGQIQEAGSVGYFCEGTPYTQDARGRSVTLLLQVGGPSGQGFMSRRQMREGVAVLIEKGRYEDGVFTWVDDHGRKHNQDSYEATWEQVHHRRVRYPKPQYEAPILLRPERYRFLPAGSGASLRRLGRFNDHGLELAQLRVEAEATHVVAAAPTRRLLVCAEGEGSIGRHDYRAWTSVELAPGESAALAATSTSVFWWFDIPVYAPMPQNETEAARFLETTEA